MHICTTCDDKYIHKGLALYQSLVNTMGSPVPGATAIKDTSWTLHWLCFDDIIYKKLSHLALPGIKLYSLPELEDLNPQLRQAKNNPKSNYGDQYSQYCWTLTPWFINWLLTYGAEEITQLIYADSDIFFYENPQIIADVVGEKAVGIHTHRFTPPFRDNIDTGWYNVGVMLFNNNATGRAISWFWKNLLLDIQNPFYKTYGTCGDQKYLELLIPIFGTENVCVFDEDEYPLTKYLNNPIGHQAPWCPDPIPSFKRRIFYHFSHFTFDLVSNSWWDHSNMEKPEWRPSHHTEIRSLYINYFETIKEAEARLSVISRQSPMNSSEPITQSSNHPISNIQYPPPDFRIDIIGNIKVDETNPERVKMLIACIRSLAFMKDHCRFMLMLNDASPQLQALVRKEMYDCGFNYMLTAGGFGGYGKGCLAMMKTCNAPYVLNFLEDHFCMLNDLHQLDSIIKTMDKFEVDLLKSSFCQVENNSINTIIPFYADLNNGCIYDNDIVNQKKYEQHYGDRYFISVHFLATRNFATEFWSRDLGPRPHEYEMAKFMPGWEHRVMVPAVELLASIDDDHGEPNTCLLKRDTEKASKFWKIYNSIL